MAARTLLVAVSLIVSTVPGTAAAWAAAQAGTIEARVVDDVSGAAVAGANVVLEPGRRTAATRADGRCSFHGLPAGSYRLEISHVAYLDARPPAVDVAAGETISVDVRLARSPVRETVVVRSRVPERGGETAAGALTGDEMSGVPGTLGDPVRGLATTPGVATVNDLQGEVRIHGAEPDDTLFRMDGVTIDNPYHFRFARASISGFDPEAFDSFEARTTALSPSIGDTVSGVIEMTPSERGGNGEFVDASVGTLSASATGGGPLEGGSWLANARYSSLTLYRNLYDVKSLSVPLFWDLLLRGRTRLAPGVDVVAGTLVLGSALSASDPRDGTSTDMNGASRTVYAGVDATLPGGSRLAARLFTERSRQWVQSTEGDDLAAKEHRTGITVDLTGGETERPAWRVGLEQLLLEGAYDGAIQSAGLISPFDARTSRTGAHAGISLTPSARWSIDAGARMDRDSRFGTGPFEPRVVATYAADAGWTVRISADRYAQFPRFEDEFLAQGAPLRIAVADELAAGATVDLGREIRADVTVFARRLRDLAAETVNRLPDLPEPVGTCERGTTRGLDLSLRKDRGRLRSRLALSLLRARETRDGVESPSNGDQPYRIDLSVAWLLTPRWDVSGRIQTASGLPLSSFVPDGDGGRTLGPLNGERLPAYHRLDVRTSWAFACWKGRGRFFVEIDNLLDAPNPRGRDLRYDPAAGRYYYHEDTGMPRVPAFGLEVSWGG